MIEFVSALMLVSAVCWLLVGAKGHWAIKSIFIVGLVLASLLIFDKISDYKGSPREVSELPNKFIHVSSVVDEPGGKIYLWIKRLNSKERCPTSVSIPYNRDVHRASQKGKEQSKGKSFVLSLMPKDGEGGSGQGEGQGESGDGSGRDRGKGAKEKGGAGSMSLESIGGVNVEQLPKGVMPKKEL